MEAVAAVVLGFIVFITLTTAGCEAFFSSLQENCTPRLHENELLERIGPPSPSLVATAPKAFGAGGEGNRTLKRFLAKRAFCWPIYKFYTRKSDDETRV